MKFWKKVWDKIWEIVPWLWGLLWLLIITTGSIALLVVVFKWLLSTMGVM